MIYGRAVVGGYGKFMKLKPRGLNNIYTATVNAFVCGSQQAAKRMEKVGGGAIVSLSSTGNLVYIENYAGHGTNKAAVEAMVRYAATELGEMNIRVNAVSGGPIDTDALKAFTNYEEVKAKTAEYSPLNRIGQPEDLAQSCYFLCTKEASWVTGHTLIVDGGTTFKQCQKPQIYQTHQPFLEQHQLRQCYGFQLKGILQSSLHGILLGLIILQVQFLLLPQLLIFLTVLLQENGTK
eukprot:TRINITY_DN60706_c0_g2_i1.p1 TRINITY_DN60706_c0_g2~~TRINITY_DN60706_c0_g2_i1.p1  ORF type:complete len:254 (+),score=-4.27 TRINITY_DN60706_c0_g2_i1:56-763(+)